MILRLSRGILSVASHRGNQLPAFWSKVFDAVTVQAEKKQEVKLPGNTSDESVECLAGGSSTAGVDESTHGATAIDSGVPEVLIDV